MAGFNKVILVGNLTRDPELKQIPSGQAVCRLGIATNRSYKNKQTGATIQEVCFVDIDVWGAQAESCKQYLSKGKSVLIEGRLKFDTWQDPQGATRSKHSISADRVVFLANSNNFEQAEGGSALDQYDAKLDTQVTYETQNSPEFAKIEQAVAKKQAAKKAAGATKAKEVGGLEQFKDEPPFEDELPF